jgi:demethylmenaquinone methyltransferase / 2-methoxy-6-polyprenyl-1,4-benzoquinol methylase
MKRAERGDAAERREVDFGFRRVPREEKRGLVGAVFESVAPRYDLMNDLMSGGVHRLWKAELVDRLRPRPGEAVLDLAGGTGDVALRILERVEARGGARIVVCDLTVAMLETGRDRALDQGILGGIAWIAGDAQALPLADASLDACAIAFGLRNVTDVAAALAEIRRVLKPGGRFFCLEFSRVVLPWLAALYDLYSFQVLPLLGECVAGDRDAYQYLVESIRRFPAQEELERLMREAGFGRVGHRNLSGGIAAIHSGWRL